MQRLIITGPKQATFEDVPTPACPDDGLLVRARMTAVSTGTELRVYRAQPVDAAGKFLHERVPFELPAENGYSMVGDVIEVGGGVSGFEVGDRVFVPAPHKQVAAVSADLAVKLPPEIANEQAVFLSILEVAHIALRRGSPGLGETIGVVGQGVIGLSAIALAKTFGLRTIAVDLNRRRLEIAQQMGADLAVSPEDDGFLESIEDFTNGGCDVTLEATSNWAGIETAMHIARRESNVVVVSRNITVPHFNPVGHPFLGKKLALLTSYGYPPKGDRWDRERSVALTLNLLANGRLNVEPMISERRAWQELPKVYARYDAGDAKMVGVVIEWGGNSRNGSGVLE